MSSATNPQNPPPLKSMDLGRWVSAARSLLEEQMDREEFDKAMAQINRVANQAGRKSGRAALQSTAKQLWSLLREG